MTPGRSNENKALCSVCRGDCCRTKPGIEAPDSFLSSPAPAEALCALLASRLWVLDRHYGLPAGKNGEPQIMAEELEILYPRPATADENAAGTVFATAGTGECVFLTDSGCRLTFAERPRMCRAVEPRSDFDCTSTWTRADAARAWLPWQDIIRKSLSVLDAPGVETGVAFRAL